MVLVMADDLGWSDLSTGRTNGGTGSDFFETPTIDRLADEGTAFDNAYAATNCAPTRAALLTGLYAPRPGNNVYQVDDLNRGGADTMLVGPPQGLSGRRRCAARATRSPSGRRCRVPATRPATSASSTSPTTRPTSCRRTDSTRTSAAPRPVTLASTTPRTGSSSATSARSSTGSPADYTQEYVDTNLKPWSHGVGAAELDELVGTDKHVSDALADATLDFVDRHRRRAVLRDDQLVRRAHTGRGRRRPARTCSRSTRPSPRRPASPSDPSYAALMEGLDQSVARIVDHLETTPDPRNPGHPLADNTVVLFTSDNGGLRKYADNGPLRGQKGELYEGGIRVPMIAWSGNPRLVDGGTDQPHADLRRGLPPDPGRTGRDHAARRSTAATCRR